MAMEIDVQRLELGDVVLIGLDGQADEVEAKVVRAIDRTDTTVRPSASGRARGLRHGVASRREGDRRARYLNSRETAAVLRGGAAAARPRLTAGPAPQDRRSRSRPRGPRRSCPSRTRLSRCRRSMRFRQAHRGTCSASIPTSRATAAFRRYDTGGASTATSAAMRTSMSVCGSRLDASTESAVMLAGNARNRRFAGRISHGFLSFDVFF